MVKVRALNTLDDLTKPFCVQAEQKKEFEAGLLLKQEMTYFVMENEKETLALIWFWNMGQGRYCVGCFLSEHAGEFFPEMRTLILRLFDFYGALRYEAICRTDFKNGHRMLVLLGFEREGTMKKFIDGVNYDLYARCL